ncbi:hypothetical protein AWT69_002784 [Pseudomonas putida]|nr:hypothetical protein AWT69_002784 [Pseudomonas putida]
MTSRVAANASLETQALLGFRPPQMKPLGNRVFQLALAATVTVKSTRRVRHH